MEIRGFSAWWFFLVLFLVAGPAPGGEPLVVKSPDGKFLPAAAAEWARAEEGSWRLVLKAGLLAADVAVEIRDRLAPITVEAQDDLILVFRGPGLTEETLLSRLAEINLGESQAKRDAMAALSNLGTEGGPALSDLDSSGSIRASKKLELPDDKKARSTDPHNVFARVIKVQPCEPLPTLTVRVTAAPRQGEHRAAFRKGKTVKVRGFYKIHDETKQIEPDDRVTQINLQSAGLKRGDRIFGRPFLKQGEVWVLHTVEKL